LEKVKKKKGLWKVWGGGGGANAERTPLRRGKKTSLGKRGASLVKKKGPSIFVWELQGRR